MNQAISHPLADAHIHLRSAYLTMMEGTLGDMTTGSNVVSRQTQRNTLRLICVLADLAVKPMVVLDTQPNIRWSIWREARLQRLAPVSQKCR